MRPEDASALTLTSAAALWLHRAASERSTALRAGGAAGGASAHWTKRACTHTRMRVARCVHLRLPVSVSERTIGTHNTVGPLCGAFCAPVCCSSLLPPPLPKCVRVCECLCASHAHTNAHIDIRGALQLHCRRQPFDCFVMLLLCLSQCRSDCAVRTYARGASSTQNAH